MATTPFKNFDVSPEEGAEVSGTFQLGGRFWSLRSSDDVPFELIRRMVSTAPAPAEGIDEDPAETQKRNRESLLQTGPFFEATVVPEQVDDFMVMFTDPKRSPGIGKLKDIMEYVTTCIFNSPGAERPTEPSRRSSPGRKKTGATSGARSSSRVTPKAASGA